MARAWFLLKKYFPKIIAVLLVLDAAFDTYESLKIIFVDIPALEQQLVSHQLAQIELTKLITGLAVKILKIALNMIFALRLSKHHEAVEVLDLILGIILLIARSYLNEFVTYLHGDTTLGRYMANIAAWFYERGKQLR